MSLTYFSTVSNWKNKENKLEYFVHAATFGCLDAEFGCRDVHSQIECFARNVNATNTQKNDSDKQKHSCLNHLSVTHALTHDTVLWIGVLLCECQCLHMLCIGFDALQIDFHAACQNVSTMFKKKNQIARDRDRERGKSWRGVFQIKCGSKELIGYGMVRWGEC